MSADAIHINQLTDHLFREQSGKIIAILVKIFGTENLQVAEDVVQDTLLQAMETWKLKGVPDNPSAWLYRVAKNKTIDILRRNKYSVQYDFSVNDNVLLRSEYTFIPLLNELWNEDLVEDDLLRMMFACCHPEISKENQIALMLKTLCGFSISEIAKSFITSDETISKRLYRTKEFFRERKIKPEFPLPDQVKVRTDAVLKTIYLIFNEGYNSTHSDTLIRRDLLDQAFYLCRLICSNAETRLADAFALMALMYFHIARIDSRTNEEGEIILLSEQDRSLWNRKWIDEGNSYMNKAAFGTNVSAYHLEAAIAYEHCSAEKFEDTNWNQILIYYDWLKRIDDSVVVLLNRFAVIYKIYGSERAIKEIERCPVKPELEKHYLYHSLMGEINSGIDRDCACKCFERALQMTQSSVEKKLLNKKIAALQNV